MKRAVSLALKLSVFSSVLLVMVPFAQRDALADSKHGTPVVVELFTSEGCSDCPPADTLLRVMDEKQPIPGAHLIVLEEHVDYWDDRGWRDPFSAHEFSIRQQQYTDELHADGPYTPEMVVDGTTEFVGNDPRKAQVAIEAARSVPMVEVELSSITSADGMVSGKIKAEAVPANADVLIALALDHAESQVSHGENGGRHLDHVAVVRELKRIGKTEKGQPFSRDFSIRWKSDGQPFRVIAIVQQSGPGKILGAAEQRLQ